MNPIHSPARAKRLLDLGQYILAEYNRKTGYFSIDPEGFFEDIHGQIDHIFAPEISAIHRAADRERAKLRDIDLKVLRIEFELALEKAAHNATKRTLNLVLELTRAAGSIGTSAAEHTPHTNIETDDIEYSVGEMAVPLKNFGQSTKVRIATFERHLARHYG